MEKEHKIWQKEWRQILGQPLDTENDISTDFVLHFDIWHLEKSQFFKLFKNFPKGEQLAERAHQLKWGDAGELCKNLNENELIIETKKAIEILQQICPSQELNDPKITVQYGDDKRRNELLGQTDPLSIEVDDQISTFIKKANGEKGYNAFFFLSEPMYRLSSSYIPRNWILWTLTNLDHQNPYTPLLKLKYNGCDAVLSNNGVLIFKRIMEK